MVGLKAMARRNRLPSKQIDYVDVNRIIAEKKLSLIVLFKPRRYLVQPTFPVLRLPRPGELMVLAMEDHHPGFDVLVEQPSEELITFGDRAAMVLVGMDEEGRGLGLSDVLQGAHVPQDLDAVGGEIVLVVAHLVMGDDVIDPDVGDAEHRDPVGDGTLGGG